MQLAPEIEQEIAGLAARYGTPQRVVVELERTDTGPMRKNDRYGEVCMVVRRPDGRLLTAIKTTYPPGAYRLLTGGINHGEPIEAALLRETYEETSLDVAIRRFLAVVLYYPRGATTGPPAFCTLAFLLDELGGTLQPQDESEQISDFRAVWPAELPAIAAFLEALAPDASDHPGERWQDWGLFRAVAHRVVYDAFHDTSQRTPEQA